MIYWKIYLILYSPTGGKSPVQEEPTLMVDNISIYIYYISRYWQAGCQIEKFLMQNITTNS